MFIPPPAGLANNGDFHKVLGAYSLAAPIDDEYRFASQTYTFAPNHYVAFGFYSTEQLLALTAIGLNRLVSKPDHFDLRFIGLVHGALFLLALWLTLPLFRELPVARRAVCLVIILFMFCDAFYLTQLNSFYMDTSALVFLLLTAVFLARLSHRGRRGDWAGLLLSALAMIASKAQHAPLGIVLAALVAMGPAAGLPRVSVPTRWSITLLLLTVSAASVKSTPWFYTAEPLFSNICYSILPRVKDPARELRSLGLDESMLQYKGKFAYSDGSPAGDRDWDREFLKKMSYGKLGWYFARHPALAFDLLTEGLGIAGRLRPAMGNFDRATGRPEFTETHAFALWSDWKRKLFEQHGGRYLTYVAALSILLCAWCLRNWQPGAWVAMALVASMLGEMILSILADPLDQVRHALLFAALSDLTLAVFLVLLSHSSTRRV